MWKKTATKREFYNRRRAVLRRVQEIFPEELSGLLTLREAGLLKYMLAQIDLSELATLYGISKNEVLLEVLCLGQKVALYNLAENRILPLLSLEMLADSSDYLRGFNDAKTALIKAAKNEFKKSR